jgi:addiction module HigA family antidote
MARFSCHLHGTAKARPKWHASREGGRLVHPGRILFGFLFPYGISQNSLARRLGVSPRRINEIIMGKRRITAETALGLGEALGPSEYFWMGLQADYDLEMARNSRRRTGAWGSRPLEDWS